MSIALDLGNTQAKIALFAADEPLLPIHVWRLDTHSPAPADLLAAQIRGVLDRVGCRESGVEGTILASVVPTMTEAWRSAIRDATQAPVVAFDPALSDDLRIGYRRASELGADRLANVIALRERVKTSAIAIDLGTATTFDCVTDGGEFLGGAIVPGLRTSLHGLIRAVPSLPEVDLDPRVDLIGSSTEECLQSGLLHGYASMVGGMVARLSSRLPGRVQVIATGGLAPLVASLVRPAVHVEPFLTLQGLHLAYRRSRHAASYARASSC